uniref:RNA polymerase Rpb4/RPC9 core domain-containing protein n=1 Tax=Pseudictyota dubia TaxID=2749911 RepID=A0A7R9VKR5_9STRA
METANPPSETGTGVSNGPSNQGTSSGGDAAAPAAAAAAAANQQQFQENAAELRFGPEFDDIHILSNAQVAVILQVSAKSAVNRDEELHEVYRKTQKYVDRFNTMNNAEKDYQELVNELDNLQDALTTFRKETEEGEEMELHGSEVAALMNLVATDTMVEEAVALIPSLSRFPEAAIDEILDLIRSTMIRIVS